MIEPIRPKWQTDLCYSTPSYAEHVVNGKKQKFYPITPAHMFRLRRLADNAAQAIALITADRSKDSKVTQHTARGAGDGIESTHQTDPAPLTLAQYRDTQQAGAWSKLVQTIFDEETAEILAGIVMESMRDIFGTKDFPTDRPDEKAFVAATPIPTFTQMIIGTTKGNKEVFGPLGDRVFSFLGELAEKVSSRAASTLSETTANKGKDSISGLPSKTPLPLSAAEPAMELPK